MTQVLRVLAVVTVLGSSSVLMAQSADESESASTKQRSARLDEAADGIGWAGFTPTIGVVTSGSGLAAGVSYSSPTVTPARIGAGFDASISFRNYQHLAGRVGVLSSRGSAFRIEPADSSATSTIRFAPEPAEGWALYFETRYRHLPAMSLFGVDAQAVPQADVRADFGQRLQSNDLVLQWQPTATFGVAGRVGRLRTAHFPGTNDDRPDAEAVFGPSLGPAVSRRVSYTVAGIAAGLDLRDNPRRPAHGTAMGAALWRYSPGDDRFAPFTRLVVNVRGYRQVGPPRHVLAAQLTGSWTWTPEPGAMPYSLLQSLGGSRTVRSFHSSRFRGRHLTAVSIESRWRAKEWLELVPFVDVGHVRGAPTWPQRPDETAVSAGFGARLWLSDRIVVRGDVAHGSDGTRLVATLNSPF